MFLQRPESVSQNHCNLQSVTPGISLQSLAIVCTNIYRDVHIDVLLVGIQVIGYKLHVFYINKLHSISFSIIVFFLAAQNCRNNG